MYQNIYVFVVAFIGGKRTYVLKEPAGNVFLKVFKIVGVRQLFFYQEESMERGGVQRVVHTLVR